MHWLECNYINLKIYDISTTILIFLFMDSSNEKGDTTDNVVPNVVP